MPFSSLNADEVRIERLAAVVELDLDVRERELDVLADALRLGGRRLGPDEHGDDLAVVVDEARQERGDRLDRGLGRRADSTRVDRSDLSGH